MRTSLSLKYSYNRPVIEIKLNGLFIDALVDTGAVVPVIFMSDKDIIKYGLTLNGRNCLLKGLGGSGELCDKYSGSIDINGILFPNISILRKGNDRPFKLLLPASMFYEFDMHISNLRQTFTIENNSNQVSYIAKVINDKTGEITSLENSFDEAMGLLSGGLK